MFSGPAHPLRREPTLELGIPENTTFKKLAFVRFDDPDPPHIQPQNGSVGLENARILAQSLAHLEQHLLQAIAAFFRFGRTPQLVLIPPPLAGQMALCHQKRQHALRPDAGQENLAIIRMDNPSASPICAAPLPAVPRGCCST